MAAPPAGPTWQQLQETIVPKRIPESEEYRWYWGAQVSPQRVEVAIKQADCGFMAPMTDLEDEMLRYDGHASSVMQKRIAALRSLPWTVTAAKGRGIDEGLAEEIADETRQAYENIPDFSGAIYNQGWGLFHARAAHEIHWATHSTKPYFRPAELAWIKARRLSFGPERELRIVDPWMHSSGFTTQGIGCRDYPSKFWTYTPKLFGEYPEREGLGPRLLYWMLFKRLSWRWRMLLLEMFALPWRIVEPVHGDNIPTASADQLEDAKKTIERLGLDATAWIPPGMKLTVVQPDAGAGEAHQTSGADADLQISKVTLGNTSTTEGGESNRSNSIVQLNAEELINASDASSMSASVNRDIGQPFTGLNYGWVKLDHAATFTIKAEKPRDVTKDLEHADKLLSMGAPLALNELYERGGWRQPEDETYVIRGADGSAQVVDPKAEPPEPATNPDDAQAGAGDLEDGGTDQADENAQADLEALERAKRGQQTAVAAARERLRQDGLKEQAVERAIELCLMPIRDLLVPSNRYQLIRTIPGMNDTTAEWLASTLAPPIIVSAPAEGEPARPFLDWVV
jgi:phage gp29-like protein